MKIACERINITTDKIVANDQLFAKIALLADNEKSVCLISMDCICLGGGIGTISDGFMPTLEQSLKALGVDFTVCGTTHTHTHEPMVCDETDILARIITAVKNLKEKLVEVKPYYALSHNNQFIINRNIPQNNDIDWTIRLAHALPPENSYEKISKADDSVRALVFKDKENNNVCTLFNFGCHPLLGFANNKATSNFPGIAEREIEKRVGGMAMMFQSTAGDVCEVDYKDYFNAKNCSSNGYSLARTVLDSFGDLQTIESQIKVNKTQVEFKLRDDFDTRISEIEQRQNAILSTFNGPLNFRNFLPLYLKYLLNPEYPLKDKFQYLKEEELGACQLKNQDERNRENIALYLKNIESMEELTRLNAEKETLIWHKDRVEKLGSTQKFDVVSVKIGEVTLVTAPFEPLNAIGDMISKRFGDKVMLIGYANGYAHYGATQEKYLSLSYETRECDLDPSWINEYFNALEKII